MHAGVVFISASKLAIVDTIPISQLPVCSTEISGMTSHHHTETGDGEVYKRHMS